MRRSSLARSNSVAHQLVSDSFGCDHGLPLYQDNPQGPKITEDQINVVLDGVRPFLDVAGGSIDIDRMEGIDGLQPTIWLHMQGASASLSSVKLEIAQRLQRHFMQPGLKIQWKEEYEAQRSRW
jgi:Fe-S cluster biogenesis protein NfuA